MDKITHQVRCEQWTSIINECLASGMNKTAWCRENGISEKQFFYWQRILRNKENGVVTSEQSVKFLHFIINIPIVILLKSSSHRG